MQCCVEDTITSQYYADMAVLDGEIEHLNAQFPNIMDSTTFPTKWKELKECLEALNKEIIVKKQVFQRQTCLLRRICL